MQNIQAEDIPLKEDGTPATRVDIDFAGNKYFDALEYVLLTTLFQRYAKSWLVDVNKITRPAGVSLSWQPHDIPGKEVKISDVLQHIPDNYFIKRGMRGLPIPFVPSPGVKINPPGGLGDKAMFPPDTTISIERGPRNSHISLTTKYISLDIRLRHSSALVGIGDYATLLSGQSRCIISLGEDHPCGHALYMLEINGHQNYLLNGHPDMEKHRKWADSITELLSTTFNFENIYKEHIQKYQVYGPEGVKEIPGI